MIVLLRRERALLFLFALLLLGAILAQIAGSNASQNGPLLSSDDTGPNGSLALALWLERLGYPVQRVSGARSTPDQSVRVLFVLDPSERFRPVESHALLDWVQQGGTLVYLPGVVPSIGPGRITPGDGLADEFGASLHFPPAIFRAGTAQTTAVPSFPFFTTPPVGSLQVLAIEGLELQGNAWVPLLVDRNAPSQVIAATEQLGRGRVYATSSWSFFTNGSIDEGDNGVLVLNILARVPAGSVVAFDEYHHGDAIAPDLAGAARNAPWGWALAYAALLTFAFALWGGRHFGPPVIPEPAPGRSAADYVTAFAGLLQRQAGASAIGWAQKRYDAHLRRRLARTYGLRADLPAADLARLVAERRRIDGTALARQLEALHGPPLGERALLKHLREIEEVLNGGSS